MGSACAARREQIARECVNIAYGFFSPLEGFMGSADVDSVVRSMTLANGYVWSIPLVLDVSPQALAYLNVETGGSVLLTYQDQPLAVMGVEEIFTYDKRFLAQQVYATNDVEHPGVARTYALEDRFVAGPITLVNPPVINPPFDQFWKTPRQLRQSLRRLGLGTSRSPPEQECSPQRTRVADERRMAGGAVWGRTLYTAPGRHDGMGPRSQTGVLVSAVVGEKKPGDYIDEAIVLAHHRLREGGFFREDVHRTSILLWDMRYAGPREAVFHALVRKNLGCTHHMFGRDHAGVGSYYDTYAAHDIFKQLPDLGIQPVLTLEWWYCPVCAGVAYEGLCGHRESKQDLSGTFIRSIIQGGTEPAPLTLRPEVLDVVRECAEAYGFGSPFVTEQYREADPGDVHARYELYLYRGQPLILRGKPPPLISGGFRLNIPPARRG